MKTFKFGESKIYLHNNDLPNNIQPPKIISVDTETTGLSLIRDRLCMVQIAFSKTECHLIKFDKDFFDRTTKHHKVRDILKDEKIEKIFHFARFDIAMLNKFLKLDLKNIFCTKIASKFVRTFEYSGMFPTGFIKINKVMVIENKWLNIFLRYQKNF